MNAQPSCRLLVAGFTLLALGVFSGCATTSDPYSITVRADRHPALSAATTKYALVYSNWPSEELIGPLERYVDAALAQRGYEAVPATDAMVLIHVDAMKESLATSTREMTPLEAGVPRNSDSPRFESTRHKNIAGMIGQGRYAQLLNDDPDAPGEIFIGPSNEIIATGDLRHTIEPAPLPLKVVVRKVTGLVLNAVAAPLPMDPADSTILWRVEVASEQELEQPAPDMRRLIEVALDYVEKSTNGRPRRVRTGR